MAKKILVIEDDNFLRELLAKKLKGGIYDISEASDAEKALQRMEEERPDLILLDLLLPKILRILDQSLRTKKNIMLLANC